MNLFRKKRIFLDYASTTPVLKEVKRAMDKYWSRDFYNPSAVYKEAVSIKRKVEESRIRIARSLGVASSGLVFTSSGTESDNLAILGVSESFRTKENKKPHIIISAIEHQAVFGAAEEVRRRGGEVSVLGVDEFGQVLPEELKKLLKKNTCLVSIGLANSEIGTIQPISKLGRVVREYRKENESTYPYLHTDASQAPNYLDVSLESLNVDLLTLDGSKMYGPKGIGVLAVRKGVEITPIIFGGRQEGGRRAGTNNPALIVGFALALEIAARDRKKEFSRLNVLRMIFVDKVRKHLPQAIFNGPTENCLPNIISVSLPNTISEFILLKLDSEGVMASLGTACSLDEQEEGSPVIRALGKVNLASSTLRFSFGRETTKGEVSRAAEIFCRVSESMLK